MLEQQHEPFIVFDEQQEVLKFYVQSYIEYKSFGLQGQVPQHNQGYFGFALSVKTMESCEIGMGCKKDNIVLDVEDIEFIENKYGLSFCFTMGDDEECSLDAFAKDSNSFYVRLYRPLHEVIQVALPSSFQPCFEKAFYRAKSCWKL